MAASRRLASLLIAAALLTAACAPRAPHPEQAIRTYAEHVYARDADTLYDSLGDDLRKGRTRAEFRAFFDENYDEIRAQADDLVRAVERDQLDIIAALPIDERNEITLHFQSGAWLLDEDSPALAGGAHPRTTLQTFAVALENEDFFTLLSLLSQEKRDILQAELNIISSGVATATDNDIVISGDVATVYLEGGLKLELRRENGAWKIHRFTQ